jgi:hypothetical protein
MPCSFYQYSFFSFLLCIIKDIYLTLFLQASSTLSIPNWQVDQSRCCSSVREKATMFPGTCTFLLWCEVTELHLKAGPCKQIPKIHHSSPTVLFSIANHSCEGIVSLKYPLTDSLLILIMYFKKAYLMLQIVILIFSFAWFLLCVFWPLPLVTFDWKIRWIHHQCALWSRLLRLWQGGVPCDYWHPRLYIPPFKYLHVRRE